MISNRRYVALASLCLAPLLGACGDDAGDSGNGTTSSGTATASGTGGGGGEETTTSSGNGGEGGTGGDGGGQAYTFRQVGGFATPESCTWDPDDRVWYVSNIGGDSEPGWISRLDEDGAVLDAKWVEGLNDPKG